MAEKPVRAATNLPGFGPNTTLGPTGQVFRFFAVGDDENPKSDTSVEAYRTEESHDPQAVGRDAAKLASAHIGERKVVGHQARNPVIDLVLSDGVVHVVSFYCRNALRGLKPGMPLETDWSWVVRGWNSIAGRTGRPTLSLSMESDFLNGELDETLVNARSEDPRSDDEALVIGYARGLWRAYEAEERQ